MEQVKLPNGTTIEYDPEHTTAEDAVQHATAFADRDKARGMQSAEPTANKAPAPAPAEPGSGVANPLAFYGQKAAQGAYLPDPKQTTLDMQTNAIRRLLGYPAVSTTNEMAQKYLQDPAPSAGATPSQERWGAAVQGAAGMAPWLPLSLMTGGAAGLGIDVATGAASGMASKGAEQLGLPPAAQTLAGLAPVVPAAFAHAVAANLAAKAETTATMTAAQKAAENAAKQLEETQVAHAAMLVKSATPEELALAKANAKALVEQPHIEAAAQQEAKTKEDLVKAALEQHNNVTNAENTLNAARVNLNGGPHIDRTAAGTIIQDELRVHSTGDTATSADRSLPGLLAPKGPAVGSIPDAVEQAWQPVQAKLSARYNGAADGALSTEARSPGFVEPTVEPTNLMKAIQDSKDVGSGDLTKLTGELTSPRMKLLQASGDDLEKMEVLENRPIKTGWDQLSTLRTRIGEMLANPAQAAGYSASQLEALYGAATEDMRELIRQGGTGSNTSLREQAQLMADFNKANDLTSELYAKRANIFNELSHPKTTPEKAVGIILKDAAEGSTAVEALRQQVPRAADALAAHLTSAPGRADLATLVASPNAAKSLEYIFPDPEIRKTVIDSVNLVEGAAGNWKNIKKDVEAYHTDAMDKIEEARKAALAKFADETRNTAATSSRATLEQRAQSQALLDAHKTNAEASKLHLDNLLREQTAAAAEREGADVSKLRRGAAFGAGANVLHGAGDFLLGLGGGKIPWSAATSRDIAEAIGYGGTGFARDLVRQVPNALKPVLSAQQSRVGNDLSSKGE